MSYRVELATTKRALCKNKECKDRQIKIDKGELRLGVWVTFGEHQSWAWRHWGCVTPAQLAGIKDALEGDMEMFDGYEELPGDLKEKVKSAVDVGHVDDDDWRGDVEQNRPGKRGFRSPAAKKKKKKKQTDNQEGNTEGEGDQSPSKPKSKKRGRSKKEASASDDVEEPTRKKAKATAKKGKKIKDEDEEDGEMAIANPAETNGSPQKIAKKGRNAKRAEEEVEAAAPEKSKAATKTRKKAVKEEDPEVSGAEAQLKQSTRPSHRIKDEKDEGNDALSDIDDHPTETSRRARASKNAANTKETITKKNEKKAKSDKVDASVADVTKVKKGRKKGGNAKAKTT
ncbi:MAG: hypothetical protein Q9222_000047 [Ikaeria aurantiellina]